MEEEIIIIEPDEVEEFAVIEEDVLIMQPNTQEKEVNPTTYLQNITPDENYTGLSKVIVNPVTNEIDENIQADNIKKDVTILGIKGNLEGLTGTTINKHLMANMFQKSLTMALQR